MPYSQIGKLKLVSKNVINNLSMTELMVFMTTKQLVLSTFMRHSHNITK